MSSTCLTFNIYTGACLSCINSNYTLTNGACLLSICPVGYTRVGDTCKYDFCKDVVPITG